MHQRIDEICVAPASERLVPERGLAPGIFPASVYRCDSPDEAERLLSAGGAGAGYVYQRDGHPNADWLVEKCIQLHGADWGVVTSSGMAALSAATLTLLRAGDHVVVTERLYGRTTQQLVERWARLGVTWTVVDGLSVDDVRSAVQPTTRLIVVETITNPMLRVAPLRELAAIAKQHGVTLLVDNTFATPYVCQPLAWGATLVLESVSKMINGHSDVMLGLLCGPGDGADYRETVTVWGLTSSPFDSWLAWRGAATLHLRMERACQNAQTLATRLESWQGAELQAVVYPGLASHPDHALAVSQFPAGRFGSIVTFELTGGRAAVERLMQRAPEIPFCPSLGEVATTLSHPASTSHRRMAPADRRRIGIGEGTIRLSVGTESVDWIWQVLERALGSL